MRTSALRVILWKEFRAQSPFLLAVTGLCLILLTSIPTGASLLGEDLRDPGVLYFIGLAMAAMYAAGSAGTTFSAEWESGTYGLLRRMPRAGAPIFWGKVVWCGGTSLLAAAVFWFLAALFATSPLRDAAMLWGSVGLGVLEVFVWCTFFSLRLRQPLAATAAGIATAALVAHASAGVSANVFRIGLDRIVGAEPATAAISSYACAWWLRLIVVVIIGGLDVVLGLRWFRYWTGRAGEGDPDAIAGADSPAWGDRWTKAINTGGVFRRLVGQHWRQSRHIVLIWIATLVPAWIAPVAVHQENIGPPFWRVLALIGALAAMAVFASFTFLGDQLKAQYRFLAHHGASPRMVWWSRQALWVAIYVVLGAITLPAMIAVFAPMSGEEAISLSNPDVRRFLWGFALYFLVAYAAGQFSSLLLRSGLLAPVAGLALAVTWMIWAATASVVGIEASINERAFSWWWSVVPLPIALLIATRLHTSDWLLERRRWIARLKWLGPPLATVIAIFTIAPFVRIYAVPYVSEVGFAVEPFTTKMNDPRTVALIQRLKSIGWAEGATESLVVPVSNDSDVEKVEEELVLNDGYPQSEWEWDSLSGYQNAAEYTHVDTGQVERHYVFLTPKGINRVRELVGCIEQRGEEAWFALTESDWPLQANRIVALLHDTATYQAEQGDYDKAFDLYLLSIRAAIPGLSRANQASQVYRNLRHRWAAAGDVSTETLQRAVRQLQQTTAESYEPLIQAKATYTLRRELFANLDVRRRLMSSEEEEALEFVHGCFPWERARDARLIRYVSAQELRATREVLTELRNSSDVVVSGQRREARNRRLRDLTYLLGEYRGSMTPVCFFLDWIYGVETDRTATRLLLAIHAWRLDHNGQLPSSLQSLVGEYIDELPISPLSGAPFDYSPDGELPLDEVLINDRISPHVPNRFRIGNTHRPDREVWPPKNHEESAFLICPSVPGPYRFERRNGGRALLKASIYWIEPID